MQLTTVGFDLAKNIFQVHGISENGDVVFNQALRRAQLFAFFEKLPPCLVGMEASGSSHYWARELSKVGHDVRRIPAMCVKTAVRPRMPNTLKIFDPAILPIAIFDWCRTAAIKEVASSGKDVPTATMVRPINGSGTPKPRDGYGPIDQKPSPDHQNDQPTNDPQHRLQRRGWRGQVFILCHGIPGGAIGPDQIANKTVNKDDLGSRPTKPSAKIGTSAKAAATMTRVSRRNVASTTGDRPDQRGQNSN